MRIRFWGTRGSIPKPGPTSITAETMNYADLAGYTGQLTVTKASGTVSYKETTSTDSSDVVVNSNGAISAATTRSDRNTSRPRDILSIFFCC